MDQTGGRVETCQAMHGPVRWQSRDLSGNVETRQVVEWRPVRQCMNQTCGGVEACQAMHEPVRWQRRDLSGNAWTIQVAEYRPVRQ
jgi:hypothetical protein